MKPQVFSGYAPASLYYFHLVTERNWLQLPLYYDT